MNATNLFAATSLLIPQVCDKPKPEWPFQNHPGFWIEANWTSFRWAAGYQYSFDRPRINFARYSGPWLSTIPAVAASLREFARTNKIVTESGSALLGGPTNYSAFPNCIFVTIDSHENP